MGARTVLPALPASDGLDSRYIWYYYHYLVVVAVPFKCMNRARWVLIFVCVAWIW
jgi:hypothetical protein